MPVQPADDGGTPWPAPMLPPAPASPQQDRWWNPATTTTTTRTTTRRDPTPRFVRRSTSRIHTVRRSVVQKRHGRSATLIFGVIMPLLLILIGTVMIAAHLESPDEPDPATRPDHALGEGDIAVNETAPPPMTAATIEPATTAPPETVAPATTATVASTTAAPTSAPTTSPTTASTAPGPLSPDIEASVAAARDYLNAIATGDFEAAAALGDGTMTAEQLAGQYAGATGADLFVVSASSLGPQSASLRLVVVTHHENAAGGVTIVRCVEWKVLAGRVAERSSAELVRIPGTTLPPDVQATASAQCAAVAF